MKILPEDCVIDVGVNGIRIHHKPTDRCVHCPDPLVRVEEVFAVLQEEIDRLEQAGQLQERGIVYAIIKDENPTH